MARLPLFLVRRADPPVPPPEDVAPTANDQSFDLAPDAANDTLVGIIALTNAPYPAEITPTITSGNDDGIFRIVYEPGQVALYVDDNTALPAADETTIALGVTLSNGVDPDETLTVSVDVAATDGVLLSIVTITEATAAAKTNEIVEFGYRVARGAMGAFTGFAVYDDDGSGGRGSILANFQADNVSTIGGDVNMVKITGIVPSLGSGATRKIRVYAETGSEPAGTAITVADVLASDAADNGLAVVSFDFDGTTYSISVAELLTSGSGTLSKTGLWLSAELWRDGPACREWICRAAPRNAGTPYAAGDGVHAEIHLSAYKAGTAAVSGGNPIIAFRPDVILRNEDAARNPASHLTYGLLVERATDVDDGTLISTDDTDILTGETIRYSYPRSEPAATLTLSSAAVGSRTVSRNAGAWPADILGAPILAGAGRAYVTARISDLQVTAYVYTAFAATSFASGDWEIGGLMHWYNRSAVLRCWIGNKPTHVWAYGDNTSAVTPTSRAHFDYLASTKAVLNAEAALASITHSMTNLNLMRSDGQYRPFTVRGPTGTKAGDIETDIGQGGLREDIGWLARWAYKGLIKYDQDGRRKIFENARYWAGYDYAFPQQLSGTPTNSVLPCVPRADDVTNYSWNSAHSGETLLRRGTPTKVSWEENAGHFTETMSVAYDLTGDLYWLQRMQAVEAWASWGRLDRAYNGLLVNKTPFGDALGVNTRTFGNSEVRARAWSFRDMVKVAAVVPDDARPTLFNPKSYHLTRVAKAQAAMKLYGPDDVTNTYLGENRWMDLNYRNGINGYQIANNAPWQDSYLFYSIGVGYELGLLDANGIAFWEWYAPGHTELYLDPGVIPELVTAVYRNFTRDNDDVTAPATTFEEVGRYAILHGPRSPGDFTEQWRQPSGTVTLSAASIGTGRTITFENAHGLDATYHVGASITEVVAEGDGNPVGARFIITSVDSPTVVTGDIVAESVGTLSVTNGSAAVVGSGTVMTSNWAGLKIEIAGVTYTILSRQDSTHLTLTTNYAGATASGVAYAFPFSSTTPSPSVVYIPMPAPADYNDEVLQPRFNYGQDFAQVCKIMADADAAGDVNIPGAAAAVTFMEGRLGYFEWFPEAKIARRTA